MASTTHTPRCRLGGQSSIHVSSNLEVGRCVCLCGWVGVGRGVGVGVKKDLSLSSGAPECSSFLLVGDVLPRRPPLEDLVLSQRRVALA